MIATAVVHRGHGSIVCFPPLETCVVPSSTMKANSQKRLSVLTQGPLGPVSVVDGVFIHRYLPFTYGKQLKVIVQIDCILWESLG